MLGKDGKPKRFSRPGDRKPLYIMQNGRPMLMNNNSHENKKHQPKNNSKIPTQQQWNYMIKKRYMKRKVKELKSKIPSYNDNNKHKAYGQSVNHLCNNRVNSKIHKQKKGRVNIKAMKNNRNNNRRNKINKMHSNEEFAFMTLNKSRDRISQVYETNLFSNELSIKDLENNDEFWIGDTGATTHITNYSAGIYNCAYPTGKSKVIMGNGTKVTRDKIGTLIGKVVQKNANYRIKLNLVVVSSEAKFNLLSLTALMKVGWQLHGDAKKLILTKNDQQLKFTHTVRTEKGLLFVIRIQEICI